MSEVKFFAVTERFRFQLHGADRVRFLNGQCSNDVRKLQPNGPAIQACVLSARGKLDAVVWIWALAESLIVECDAAVTDALEQRLERYIVSDDVSLEPLGLVGDTWHVLAKIPDWPASHVRRTISRLGDADAFDVEGVTAWQELVDAGATELPPADVERCRIERGIPAWGSELGPDTLPAEAGLDRTAVDFHKGCYLGQEVVSRIESVGHANRILRGFTVISGQAPAIGDVFSVPDAPAKASARVTSVAFGMSNPIGLCYTHRSVNPGG